MYFWGFLEFSLQINTAVVALTNLVALAVELLL